MRYSIREISMKTNVNYRLTHQEIISLHNQGIISIEKMGPSSICSLNIEKDVPLYTYIESLRKDSFQLKHKSIKVILHELRRISTQYYTLLVFGSYASGKEKRKSDLDLLFVIPDRLSAVKFEREVKSLLHSLSYKLDINVITENSLMEMKNATELNIVNEVIKNHIILRGAEQYFHLLGK